MGRVTNLKVGIVEIITLVHSQTGSGFAITSQLNVNGSPRIAMSRTEYIFLLLGLSA